MRKLIKKVEKPAFFDLLLKFNQNCEVVFIIDSETTLIDSENEYYVDNIANDEEEEYIDYDDVV
jgi:hypothetical protein